MNIITPDELAAMLKLPRRTVIESVSKLPGFPQSITGRRIPRWDADAVARFFKLKSKVNFTQSSHNA